LPCRDDGWCSIGDNDIDLEPDELCRNLGEALAASLRPTILDLDVATLVPAEFMQLLHKRGHPLSLKQRRARAQEPNGRQLCRLLRARRERPHSRRAAENRDERTSVHSITSSARASSVGGTSMPSALAVWRLMTSSYLVGACTGR